MLPAKYQPYRPGGSGEEDFLMFFYHIWAWRHLEFWIKTILAIFSLWAMYGIWLHLAQWFERRSRLKVWTDDGRFPSYKLPRSIRLRGPKM